MLMPKRSYSSAAGYRYGFNGKENDNDVKGLGNQQDYGMRIYDPRLGKFLTIDPLFKGYPELTPYQFASNTPIGAIDLDGLEGLIATGVNGNGMVVSPEMAQGINKNIVVTGFKAVFSETLPRKFISNYAWGNGKPYVLNTKELSDLHIYKTGLHGGSENDIKKTSNFLSSIKMGESKALPEGYSISGGAGLAGTLGRFTIELKGVVTKDKKDDQKWNFNGKMRFVDNYDFITGPTQPGDLERNEWGNFQTEFANKYLPGTPFHITSEWIDIKQEQEDSFDWFDGKSQTDVPNRLGNSNSRETKEVKNSGTSTGETKKRKG